MDSDPSKTSAFNDLRALLLTPEKNRLAQVENRLDDPMKRAEEISKSLPDAISLSVTTDNKLSRVIQPVIDESLKESVRKNPKQIADAIYPALGPGIRKAISSTLMGMIQSLNQVLNHSLSIQGMKWRFEAFRTGRQFAEVVMLHTLLYRVEQIFLIHSDSGIVLEHVVAEDVAIQDPDLVSGMLTAIQDFVRDSFHSDTEEDLDTLRMGSDRSVWVEKGDQAFLATVIKGTPPVELRESYRELVEEIHLKAGSALAEFDGDTHPFSLFRDAMTSGLTSQEKKDEKKISPFIYGIAALILILPSIWGYSAYTGHQEDLKARQKALKAQKEWEQRLDRIRDQEGVIVLSSERDKKQYRITGLKDPLVEDPLAVLGQDRSDIQAVWQPFYSLDQAFVLQRASLILSPPDGITLNFNQGRLTARGKASQKWIEDFQDKAVAIPGIMTSDAREVANQDQEALEWAVKKLERFKIYFVHDSTELIEGQELLLSEVVDTIREIQRKSVILRTRTQIIVLGHTDSSGSPEHNLMLSRERAQKILAQIIAQGIDSRSIHAQGVATSIVLKQETELEDRQYNRAVTFNATGKME